MPHPYIMNTEEGRPALGSQRPRLMKVRTLDDTKASGRIGKWRLKLSIFHDGPGFRFSQWWLKLDNGWKKWRAVNRAMTCLSAAGERTGMWEEEDTGWWDHPSSHARMLGLGGACWSVRRRRRGCFQPEKEMESRLSCQEICVLSVDGHRSQLMWLKHVTETQSWASAIIWCFMWDEQRMSF